MNIFSWILLLLNLSLVLFAIHSFIANRKEHIFIFLLLEVGLVSGAALIFYYQLAPVVSVISMLITVSGAALLFAMRKITEERFL